MSETDLAALRVGETGRKVPLKAPYPYFGGKSRIAALVWARLGDVRNYVEACCGSAAMLLLRPHPPQIETVNDIDCMVANFWRAVQHAADEVVEHVNSPVNEADLHARHHWLVYSDDALAFRERMKTDPMYYDARIAGWWCWGLCQWIGSGWCRPQQMQHGDTETGRVGEGVHHVSGSRLEQKRPHLTGNGGGKVGVNSEARPQLADAYSRGRGVHGHDAAETCAARRTWLLDWFGRLRDRLRSVRVCCGDWSRVCSSQSTTTRLGLTGVFLDPPYPTHDAAGNESRDGNLYARGEERGELDRLRDAVLAWCREYGPDRQMRIAVCGYDTDGYAALEAEGWEAVAWKTQGGYANRGKGEGGNANAGRERVW